MLIGELSLIFQHDLVTWALIILCHHTHLFWWMSWKTHEPSVIDTFLVYSCILSWYHHWLFFKNTLISCLLFIFMFCALWDHCPYIQKVSERSVCNFFLYVLFFYVKNTIYGQISLNKWELICVTFELIIKM